MKRPVSLIMLLISAVPAMACGAGGAPDRAAAVKARLAIIDGYLHDPQKLAKERSVAQQAGTGDASRNSPPDAAALARVQILRREGADLMAAALKHRLRNGARSDLAARQLERAAEKTGEALLALGIPALAAGQTFRCGLPRKASPQA